MEMSERQNYMVDTATSVLETLLSLMGIPASVEASVTEEEGAISSVAIDIVGEDLGILIGRRGQTLTSLQYIVRLIVAHQTQERLPLAIDIEGYKQRRYEALQALAWRIAEQVRVKRASLALEPMSAFERRIVHLALAEHPDVTTESTGQGEARKVVILPKSVWPD